MQYKRKYFLWLLVALMIFSTSCTKSASTPPPKPEGGNAPTDVQIQEPTATTDPEQVSSDERLVRVYPDVPIADCSVKFLNDYACLLESALSWVKENNLITPCEEGFCPDDGLTLGDLYFTLPKSIITDQTKGGVDYALEEIYPNKSFSMAISRGSISEVFRLIFYPEYRCQYQNYYTDMDEENIYTCAAEALLDNELYLLEDLNTDFKPEDNITRGQFAVMLYLQLTEGRLQ